MAQLTKVRRKLAEAKTSTTIEYVQNILDQGDKVLVFSCFDAPLKKIHKRFGDAAVLLTGATPADKRQGLVDRFQAEEGVRVFVANILAGGVGLNLTAAQQVVFNDLDWVPANHWQAEDRAYRIGQERSVHVAYMVAEKTVDEFVRTVLETKAALVSSVVEGKALSDGATRDVLSELERIVGLISPKMADTSAAEVTGDQVRAWLQEASAHFHEAQPDRRADVLQADTIPDLSDAALQALVRVLQGPKQQGYQVESNSKKGSYYEITVDGQDALCSCPGFSYRGTCSHARKLKTALAAGNSLPKGFKEIE